MEETTDKSATRPASTGTCQEDHNVPKVTMPQLGESVAEGTIGRWLKQVGDHVDKYEPIVEVVTDKVNAEVPSPFEGTLSAILVQEGETVANNTEIAVIDGVGEATVDGAAEPATSAPAPAASANSAVAPASSVAPPAAAEAPPAAPVATAPSLAVTGGNGAASHGPAGSDERSGSSADYEGRVTPAVRRLAREHEIDLAQVPGTGHAGRVTREDVLAYIERRRTGAPEVITPQASGAATAPTSSDSGAPGATPSATPVAPPTAPPMAPAPAPAVADSLKPMTQMRKAIAAQMTRALQVPHAYTTIEVDMSPVVRHRAANKRAYQEREGVGLSYVAFVTKATVEALRRHPDMNAHWTDEGLWRRKAINVGIAVAVDDGLVVPVIKDADSLSIHGLNRAINELADRARTNRLRLDDIQGGTFTVDNTGWTGSNLTMPIINVPEVSIVTMEAIVKRAVVIETPQGDLVGVRSMMNMVLAIDHRATDGAQAGRFLATIKQWLESVDESTSIW
jgi:2-oxoisovalerate dehydrogenase E2 component (dihydrolipoyl transacylase)